MTRSAVILLLAVLGGCTVGPDYRRPQLTVPPQFRDQSEPSAASLADQDWWDVFRDETLRSLIAEALKNSPSVHLAAWRVEEYRALAGIARAQGFPQLVPAGQWQRGRQSEYVKGGGATGEIASVNLGIAWEIDLWGRIRRLNEAALAQYLASAESRRGVTLSVTAEVAEGYFQLRELDARLEVAREVTQTLQQTRDLFGRRLAGGTASGLETARAEAALATAAATVPNLERQIAAQENLLSFLVGRSPGPIPRGADLARLWLPPEIPAGLPSALLERRPDLREAEQRLRAANAGVGVATANRLPAFSLTGAFGGVSPYLSDLFGKGLAWNLGASLAGPILQGGRLAHQRAAAVAQWQQAKVLYEAAVANSLREVSTALTDRQKLAEMEVDQELAVAAAREAVRLVNLRYLSGLSSYLEVLDAEQQLLPTLNTLAQTRFARLQNLVQIYKALGGGWNLADPASSSGDPR